MANVGDILGAGAQFLGSLFGYDSNRRTNEANLEATRLTNQTNKEIADQNLAFQKEKYNYEQQLQERLFAREDTSYQRTVSDMKSAGLSPLTLGGLNKAGTNVLTTTPQNSYQAQTPQFQAYDPSSSFNALGNTLSSVTQHYQQSLLNEEDLKQKKIETEYKRHEKLLDLQNKVLTNENLDQDKKQKELNRIEKQLEISQKRLDLMFNTETYDDRKSKIKSDSTKAQADSKKAQSESKVAESTAVSQIEKAAKDVEKVQSEIQKSTQDREIENTNFQQAKSISQQFGVPMYALRSPREFIAYYNYSVKAGIIQPTKATKKFVKYLKKFEGQKDSERIGFSVVDVILQSGQLGINALNSLSIGKNAESIRKNSDTYKQNADTYYNNTWRYRE